MSEKKPAQRRSVSRVQLDALVLRKRAPSLLLANPNYFGTLEGTEFQPVTPIAGDTVFEELRCVGLNPGSDQLEAVVRVKQTAGYSGPLCGHGSTEYVRFHLSYDNGATWADAGGDSFTVHDSAGTRPLDFAVNVQTPISHRWCILDNQPRLRAILSWNHEPTPGDAGFTPVWGNVVEVTVQPRSTFHPPFWELLEVAKVKLSKALLDQIDLEAPVVLKQKAPLTMTELVAAYANTDVAPHRFLSPVISKALDTKAFGFSSKLPVAPADPGLPPLPKMLLALNLSELVTSGIDLSKVIAQLAETDGDTSFEELGCIGYDPVEDALVGVLTVKRPNGYSGGRCTTGSTEYVAFWVDWGSGLEYAGTATVNVHDDAVPAGGVRYAVYLPLSTYAHRRACADGAVEPKVRATLSWEYAPPTSDPDWVPTWGNREETHIQLPTGLVVSHRPVLDGISGVPVCHIDPATGLTIGGDQPFGATLPVTGFIPGVVAGAMKYRVQVRPAGGVWTTVNTPFTATVNQVSGSGNVSVDVPMNVDAEGYYTYLGGTTGPGSENRVFGNLLVPWITAEPMTGRWEVTVDAKDLGGSYPAQITTCSDGTVRTSAFVWLDEVPPVPDLEILTVTSPGGSPQPTGPCKKFKVGDVLAGSYAVSDEHFSQLQVTVEPASSAMGTLPTLSGPAGYPAAPTTGTSGDWSLDTALMAPCGYVMTLWAWDRTINGSGGWGATSLFGFSLEAPTP